MADKKVELLEGDIVKISPEVIQHSYTNRSVVKYLRNQLNGLAEVIQAQLGAKYYDRDELLDDELLVKTSLNIV